VRRVNTNQWTNRIAGDRALPAAEKSAHDQPAWERPDTANCDSN
jgi:hypothetical protein